MHMISCKELDDQSTELNQLELNVKEEKQSWNQKLKELIMKTSSKKNVLQNFTNYIGRPKKSTDVEFPEKAELMLLKDLF